MSDNTINSGSNNALLNLVMADSGSEIIGLNAASVDVQVENVYNTSKTDMRLKSNAAFADYASDEANKIAEQYKSDFEKSLTQAIGGAFTAVGGVASAKIAYGWKGFGRSGDTVSNLSTETSALEDGDDVELELESSSTKSGKSGELDDDVMLEQLSDTPTTDASQPSTENTLAQNQTDAAGATQGQQEQVRADGDAEVDKAVTRRQEAVEENTTLSVKETQAKEKGADDDWANGKNGAKAGAWTSITGGIGQAVAAAGGVAAAGDSRDASQDDLAAQTAQSLSQRLNSMADDNGSARDKWSGNASNADEASRQLASQVSQGRSDAAKC